MRKEDFYTPGKYKIHSGKVVEGYWDFRPLVQDDAFIDALVHELWIRHPDDGSKLNVVGVEFWGAGMCIAMHRRKKQDLLNTIIWRKPRDHGNHVQFYGKLESCRTVVLDDVISTGDTVGQCLKSLEGRDVSAIYCLKNLCGFTGFAGVPIEELFE